MLICDVKNKKELVRKIGNMNNRLKSNDGKTIRSIAKEAGVSISTVSRVINRPEMTSEAMKDKVMPVIEKYGYVPNLMAKNLYSKHSNTIAIFVYDMMNPFFLSIIKELNKIVLKHKYHLIICDTENKQEQEYAYYEYCKAIRCSGIILTEGINHIDKVIANEENGSVINPRIVSLDRHVNDDAPLVSSDNHNGIKDAVNHLIKLGHKKIAFAGLIPHMHSIQERFDGYCEAMQEGALPITEEHIFKVPALRTIDGVNVYNAFANLNNRPSALICSNDQIAKGFVMRASEEGLKIPQDCSIIGFDGVLTYDTWPRLTTMKQNIPAMSEALFQCLTQDKQCTRARRFETTLLEGQTCAPVFN